jgi:uncharacterized OsmC-like protein
MYTYQVELDHLHTHESVASCKHARIAVDADPQGRDDAFNPAELLLAALGTCMLKNIERVAPMLKFALRGAHITLQGERQDVPPRMQRITYLVVIDTEESDQRLDLLHRNLQQFGTVYNTLAAATTLEGRIERGTFPERAEPGR